MGWRGLLAKRKGSLRLTACLKVVIFVETGVLQAPFEV
jgi:hypothetical protein